MNTNTSYIMTSMLMDISSIPAEKERSTKYPPADDTVFRLKVGKRDRLPDRRFPAPDSPTSGLTHGALRRIKQEIDNDDLDLRVVMTKCRGLVPGTSRFSEAYIAGRMDTLSHSRQYQTGLPHLMYNCEMPTDGHTNAINLNSSSNNPYVMLKLRHLLSFFGPGLTVLFASQIYASWIGSAWLCQYLEGGRYFYAALMGLMFFSADSAIWIINRGKYYTSFHTPGLKILMISLLIGSVFVLMKTLTSLN